MTDRVDALVIFGATGDLAKLETFPALVGLVARGVLDVPVIGVGKSGWELPMFRDYAATSLRNNNIDPKEKAAAGMLHLLDYIDGDLTDAAGRVRERDGVVPCRDTRDPARKCRGVEIEHHRERAARLETAGALKELLLQPHLCLPANGLLHRIVNETTDRGRDDEIAEALAVGADFLDTWADDSQLTVTEAA